MQLRKYESFFIVDPDLPEDAYQGVAQKFRGVVESGGGTVLTYAPWGKKKLAYSVKKKSYGYYVLMEFASGPDLIAELERTMRIDERVLKFITVKLDDEFDPEKDKDRERPAPMPPDDDEGESPPRFAAAHEDEEEEEDEGEEED
ncbi:MAG: 30S ribosomal protein S6 [Desulfosoma sp.]|uniref:30S ribosomal protein S6 n=1 Tax=Desulfosoma sp. TaxID=2603217 RepID=UPI00404A1192